MKQVDHFLYTFLDDVNNKALQKHVTESAKATLEQYVRALLWQKGSRVALASRLFDSHPSRSQGGQT